MSYENIFRRTKHIPLWRGQGEVGKELRDKEIIMNYECRGERTYKTNWQGFLSSSKKEGNRMVNLAAGYKRSNPYGTVGEVIPPPAPSKGGYARTLVNWANTQVRPYITHNSKIVVRLRSLTKNRKS